MTAMEWGPEVKVDGRRPEWLRDFDLIRPFGTAGEFTPWRSAWAHGWDAETVAIRLRSDHPHYARWTTTSDSLSDEALALCRAIRKSGSLYYAKEVTPLYKRACEIAAKSADPVVTALANADIVLSHRIAALDVRREKPGEDLAADKVERMKALIKRMAERQADPGGCLDLTSWLKEADAIVAPPADLVGEDLLAARQAVANTYIRSNMPGLAERAIAGLMDNRLRVQAASEAFRSGRALGKGEAA